VTFAAHLAAYVALSTTALMLLRRSLAGAELGELATDPRVLAGAALYAASFGTFLLALRHFEVLTVFPVFLASAYAATTVAAAVFLGESLTSGRVAGLLLVGAGLVLLAR